MAARSSGGSLRSAARASSSEHAGRLEQERREQVVLAALDGQQPHGRAGLLARARARSSPSRAAQRSAACSRCSRYSIHSPPRSGPLHARHEARHHRLQLLEDHARVVARLRQRRRRQPQQQLLVGLAARRRCPCARATRRAAGRAAGRAPSPGSSACARPRARRRLAGSAPPPRPRPAAAPRSRRRRASPSRLVLRPERGVAPVAVAEPLAHRGVVGDVARGLLEVGGEPAALEQLRHHVRDPLAGDVGAAELRDRVVAVADEDPLVELARALALGAVERARPRATSPGELVEEQPPERALVARVAREQRALHGLGQVHEREHRPVEVREVRREQARSSSVKVSTG